VSTLEPQVYTDLSAIVLPSDLYTVLSATQSDMDLGPDGMVDSAEISFMVNGRMGVFTVEIPLDSFRVFENGIDLTSEAGIVNALYTL
jgi:hypothetical protein